MEKFKILYVDDEEINLMLFKVHFDKKFNVKTADCGSQGLNVLNEVSEIMIVISDLKMPNMSGLEFIKKAKSEHHEIKFFILSGYEITSEIEEALASGLILDYFRKPFNTEAMEKAINKALCIE